MYNCFFKHIVHQAQYSTIRNICTCVHHYNKGWTTNKKKNVYMPFVPSLLDPKDKLQIWHDNHLIPKTTYGQYMFFQGTYMD